MFPAAWPLMFNEKANVDPDSKINMYMFQNVQINKPENKTLGPCNYNDSKQNITFFFRYMRLIWN